MGGSTFKVDIQKSEDVDDISANGMDSVEFMISPNVGEPLKPLAKIISGGEMSRFMLAFKIFSQASTTSALWCSTR